MQKTILFLLLLNCSFLQSQNLLDESSTTVETVLEILNNPLWELKEKCVNDTCKQVSWKWAWGIETNHFRENAYHEFRGKWDVFVEDIDPITYQKITFRTSCPMFFNIIELEDSITQKTIFQINRIGEGKQSSLILRILNLRMLFLEGIETFHNGQENEIRETYFLRKEKH